MIDSHAHIDGPEFADDLADVIARARANGIRAILLPAINADSSATVAAVCRQYPNYAFPMLGLHPEEVKEDSGTQLDAIYATLTSTATAPRPIAIGEVGLDFYWSREFEREQLQAFERQVEWSIQLRLPLMIHCRKAQNEMVRLLRHYASELPGGVFHCFTGNEKEAAELLQFERFALGIGGVFTFKKSPLPALLPQHLPLERLVLETDSPYMAPVPMRGKRNEPSFVAIIAQAVAQAYNVSIEELSRQTDSNIERIFGISLP